MTRFARAKGSKASNERVANEATPWHVMKEQLEDNIAMKKHQPTKAKSAKQLLSEKEEPFYVNTIGSVNNEWAEFETSGGDKTTGKKSKESNNSKITQKSKKNENKSTPMPVDNGSCTSEVPVINDYAITPKSKQNENTSKLVPINNDNSDTQSVVIETGEITQKKLPKKRKSDVLVEVTSVPPVEQTEKGDVATETQLEKKKRKKKDKKLDSLTMPAFEAIKSAENPEVKEDDNSKLKETSGKISKRHKRNQKRKNKIANEKAAADGAGDGKPEVGISGGFDAAGNDWSSNVNFGKQSKLDPSRKAEETENEKNFKKPANRPNVQENGQKRKAPKIRDDKEHKRRKPDGGVIKCVINGMEVEIVKYDGFPVKKEDAERLKELRQKMIMKGIPKKEIDVAMKLERRKAEKALARVRKQVCFHCRKAGHNLSDCPELDKEESATGICFKCGSTEHTHFECKVTKKEEFRFASCFICREQGHIAKQCPDNPRGLYPQGGACKICGDVTHLKKDCPDLTKENEESIVTLGTIAENTLESLDDDGTTKTIGDGDKKLKSKVVKF